VNGQEVGSSKGFVERERVQTEGGCEFFPLLSLLSQLSLHSSPVSSLLHLDYLNETQKICFLILLTFLSIKNHLGESLSGDKISFL